MGESPPVRQTPEQMKALGEQLQNIAGALIGFSEAMTQAQFTDLPVKNNDQRKRGMEYMENYLAAARKALLMAREARSDFATEPKSTGKKKRGRPKNPAY